MLLFSGYEYVVRTMMGDVNIDHESISVPEVIDLLDGNGLVVVFAFSVVVVANRLCVCTISRRTCPKQKFHERYGQYQHHCKKSKVERSFLSGSCQRSDSGHTAVVLAVAANDECLYFFIIATVIVIVIILFHLPCTAFEKRPSTRVN
jgi:hypothetical protein